MTPERPTDPQKASADEVGRDGERSETGVDEPTPDEAAAAKKATAEEAAAEAAEQPEAKPKRRRPAEEAESIAVEEPADQQERADAEAARAAAAAEEAAEAAEEAAGAAQRRRGRKRGEEPAPARKRDRRTPAPAGVTVRAQAKYVRTSARKARLVCDHIRGKDVAEARAILAFTPRDAAKAWSKLLESAVANAEHNHELVGDELTILNVHADEGPTLKRYRPRAMGRATRIRKRTSHLTITLTPKES